MARRDEQQYEIHYATLVQTNLPDINGNDVKISPADRRRSIELERAKALYVDFDNAFRDNKLNYDYFGCQPSLENSHDPANFYLQSVETISEIKNTNISPYIRRHTSRENSRPSTPLDTLPYQLQLYQNPQQLPPPILPPTSNHHHHTPITNSTTNLHNDFNDLNLLQPNPVNDLPAPFTPDAIQIKIKQNELIQASLLSSQFKLILPQYFLVKYLGRKPCTQLWGSKAVRTPIDDMVQSARQMSSMNEMPTLEACINTRGLTLAHRHAPTHSKHPSRAFSPERHQHGLIPLEHISYVMHDVKYSKISACIVLRQSKSLPPSSSDQVIVGETVTECYAFLFQSKDHAHRFALSLAEAFNAQKHSSKTPKTNHDDKRAERSPQRRSKHRTTTTTTHHHHHHHHNEKTRSRYDDTYLRDSEV
ncbi:unnamed protein product [Adineta ricciae]|uniref:Uncharacterized protein n=1 Tax=Adineta ricciae TaxID=249248 RepID=A0A815SAR6_ADIRI|nr:unnamed protein product [Adineta ricciae]